MPNPTEFAQLAENLVDTLVELHELDYKAMGLGELGNPEAMWYVK